MISSQTKVLLFRILFLRYSLTRCAQINNNTTHPKLITSARTTKIVFKTRYLPSISKETISMLNKTCSRDNSTQSIDQKEHAVHRQQCSVYKILKKVEVIPNTKSTLREARKFTQIKTEETLINNNYSFQIKNCSTIQIMQL